VIRRARILALFLVAVLIFSACRVDVAVDVQIDDNGTGMMTVTLVADREVVEQAPGLADDLHFSDVERVGWKVDGPTAGEEGSLTVVLSHIFASPEEATALIASLNGPQGPFKSVLFTRTKTPTKLTFTVSGAGRVDGGMAAFADTDLMNLIGGVPYTSDIANVGLSAEQAVPVALRVSLPGKIISTTGTNQDGAITWTIPMDGSQVDLGSTATVSLERGGAWATIATILRIALIAWLVFCVLLISTVIVGRRKRSHRRRRRPRRDLRPGPLAD
jgi:hypothetical protein